MGKLPVTHGVGCAMSPLSRCGLRVSEQVVLARTRVAALSPQESGLIWRLPQRPSSEHPRADLRSSWGDETPPSPPALSGRAHLGTRGALTRLLFCAFTPQRSPTGLAPAVGEERTHPPLHPANQALWPRPSRSRSRRRHRSRGLRSLRGHHHLCRPGQQGTYRRAGSWRRVSIYLSGRSHSTQGRNEGGRWRNLRQGQRLRTSGWSDLPPLGSALGRELPRPTFTPAAPTHPSPAHLRRSRLGICPARTSTPLKP